jgi:hypothetical protein
MRWGSPTGPPREITIRAGKEMITNKENTRGDFFSKRREGTEQEEKRKGRKKAKLAKASCPKMSAPTAPYDAQQPAATNHSPSSESEKPSHASSLAGPKDEADAAATTTTTTPTPSPGLFSRKWALGPVVKDYGDYGLLACSFVTGMVDGASFLNWGVFVGMQTGEFFLFCFLLFGIVVWSIDRLIASSTLPSIDHGRTNWRMTGVERAVPQTDLFPSSINKSFMPTTPPTP